MNKNRFYGINHPSFDKQINKDYFNPKAELGYQEVNDAIILPLKKANIAALNAIYEGGVCDKKFNFIEGYKRSTDGRVRNFDVIRAYKPSEKVNEVDEEVIFGGVAHHHFGHFIAESFARLWWVIENQEKFGNHKLVFVKTNDMDYPQFKLLDFLGLKNEIIFLDKPTSFRKVYIPDQSLYFFNYFTNKYSLPYDSIIENVNKKEIVKEKGYKIYLSRTQFKKQDIINEMYFEKFYRDQGYKIVYPEKLSLEEQIATVSNADEMVSTIGTLSHLALFAKKGAKVVTLLRSRDYCIPAQVMINQAKQLDYAYVDVTCNFLPTTHVLPCSYIGPTSSWKKFVKDNYNIELDINLTDYLNSENSRMGDYFQRWMQTFSSNKKWMGMIFHHNTATILDNLETVFSNDAETFPTAGKQYIADLPATKKTAELNSLLKGKIFKFSRYDDSHMRVIVLNPNGTIETVNGKGHKNESFWKIENGELVFLDNDRKPTSKYFYLSEKENGIEAMGYYEKNRSIIFKLKEIIV